MVSRSKNRSSDMNVDYKSQKLATSRVFTFKKIEEFTSEKSVDSKDNPSSYLSEKSNSSASDQNIKIKTWSLLKVLLSLINQ